MEWGLKLTSLTRLFENSKQITDDQASINRIKPDALNKTTMTII